MIYLLAISWLCIAWSIAHQDVRPSDGFMWWWSMAVFVCCDILVFWID